MYKEMSCNICGKTFTPKSGNQLRCPDCYWIGKSKKQEKNYENKYCVVCGKEYKPTSGKQKTCSEECGKIEKSRYQAEWYRERKVDGEHYEKKPKVEGCHYEKIETKKSKKKDSDLTADVVAARKLGVSYGKYIAYFKRGGAK